MRTRSRPGRPRRAFLRLSGQDPSFEPFQCSYHTRSALLHVNCFYDGNCEPEQEMADLIRATITYIQTADTYIQTADTYIQTAENLSTEG